MVIRVSTKAGRVGMPLRFPTSFRQRRALEGVVDDHRGDHGRVHVAPHDAGLLLSDDEGTDAGDAAMRPVVAGQHEGVQRVPQLGVGLRSHHHVKAGSQEPLDAFRDFGDRRSKVVATGLEGVDVQRLQRLLEHRSEQAEPVLEVIEDASFRYSGPLSDLARGQPRHPALTDQLQCRSQDLFPTARGRSPASSRSG
jgi:hypothetical protein